MKTEHKIIVASTNTSKIEAVRNGFTKLFPGQHFAIQGVSVPSGVRDQPLTSEETLKGAAQRVAAARAASPGADFYVGIEGGVDETATGMMAFSWVVIEAGDGRVFSAQTAQLLLPPRLAEVIRSGKTMCESAGCIPSICEMDLKVVKQQGLIGLATGGTFDRQAWCEQAVIIALIPFKNAEWYKV